MAHFYGTLNGNRGEATRAGSKNSGLVAVAASWSGAIKVVLEHGADGRDHYTVMQTTWQGAGRHEVLAQGVVGEPTAKT